MRIGIFSHMLKACGLIFVGFGAVSAQETKDSISENISTPVVYCKSKPDTFRCLQDYSDLWSNNLQKRMTALKTNCLENAFCGKQLDDLDGFWKNYNELLGRYLLREDNAENKIRALSEYVVNLQHHLLALGYGCTESSSNCVTVDGEKQLQYSLQHLVSYYTGLSSDVLFEDSLREATIMEIDDMLNIQYKKLRDQCPGEDCRTKLKEMEISWIKYKEKMLNYLEDPMASGSDSNNYFVSDMFLILTSLHQTEILGFSCPDGELKCIVDENKLRDSAREYEKVVDDFEENPKDEQMKSENSEAPSEIDVTDYSDEENPSEVKESSESVSTEGKTSEKDKSIKVEDIKVEELIVNGEEKEVQQAESSEQGGSAVHDVSKVPSESSNLNLPASEAMVPASTASDVSGSNAERTDDMKISAEAEKGKSAVEGN
jgi:hypothetical protein